MKSVRALIALCLLFTAAVFAQMTSGQQLMKVNIPFAFGVQDQSLPAGQYLVSTVNEGAREAGKVQSDIHSVEELARSGDGKAADWLGWSYMTGTGVSQNYYQAAQWFRQAAEQGLADAEFALGNLYEQGKGVGRDYRKAVVYYTAAARQGHVTAENNLASMYEHGQGAQRDLQEAVRWYRAAAEQGDNTKTHRIKGYRNKPVTKSCLGHGWCSEGSFCWFSLLRFPIFPCCQWWSPCFWHLPFS